MNYTFSTPVVNSEFSFLTVSYLPNPAHARTTVCNNWLLRKWACSL